MKRSSQVSIFGSSQVSGDMSRRSSARVRRARRLALRLAQAHHGFERHGNRCPAVVQQCTVAARMTRLAGVG